MQQLSFIIGFVIAIVTAFNTYLIVSEIFLPGAKTTLSKTERFQSVWKEHRVYFQILSICLIVSVFNWAWLYSFGRGLVAGAALLPLIVLIGDRIDENTKIWKFSGAEFSELFDFFFAVFLLLYLFSVPLQFILIICLIIIGGFVIKKLRKPKSAKETEFQELND